MPPCCCASVLIWSELFSKSSDYFRRGGLIHGQYSYAVEKSHAHLRPGPNQSAWPEADTADAAPAYYGPPEFFRAPRSCPQCSAAGPRPWDSTTCAGCQAFASAGYGYHSAKRSENLPVSSGSELGYSSGGVGLGPGSRWSEIRLGCGGVSSGSLWGGFRG